MTPTLEPFCAAQIARIKGALLAHREPSVTVPLRAHDLRITPTPQHTQAVRFEILRGLGRFGAAKPTCACGRVIANGSRRCRPCKVAGRSLRQRSA